MVNGGPTHHARVTGQRRVGSEECGGNMGFVHDIPILTTEGEIVLTEYYVGSKVIQILPIYDSPTGLADKGNEFRSYDCSRVFVVISLTH